MEKPSLWKELITPLVLSVEIDFLFLEVTTLAILDSTMFSCLKQLISNGHNPLTKNQEMILKTVNLKSVLQNLELITLLISIKEKFTFSEVMEELDMKELPLMICIISMSILLNGLNLITLKEACLELEEDTHLLC